MMGAAAATAPTAREVKGRPAEHRAEPASDAGAAARGARAPSLRDRLAQFFRSGQNASDRELAAMFGASVGSISVYRCQLKKLGVGVASPAGTRQSAGKSRSGTGSGTSKTGKRGRSGAASGAASAKSSSRSAGTLNSTAARGAANPLSLAEIDQVLVQNIETELGLIVERYPDLARAAANVQQTVRLLLKLHRA